MGSIPLSGFGGADLDLVGDSESILFVSLIGWAFLFGIPIGVWGRFCGPFEPNL